MYKSLKAFRQVGTKVERCKQLRWQLKSTTIAATLLLAAGILSSCENAHKKTKLEKPFIIVNKYINYSSKGEALYYYQDAKGFEYDFKDSNNRYYIGDTLR